MNLSWLLKTGTIVMFATLSCIATIAVMVFSPGGMSTLRKRQAELISHKLNLYDLSKRNRQLYDEIIRLNKQDPELMEALVRSLGYDRPGEKVYVFGEQASRQ